MNRVGRAALWALQRRFEYVDHIPLLLAGLGGGGRAEALTHGPDPLHLSVVFGIDDKTAIRYASAARQLLDSSTEHNTPG